MNLQLCQSGIYKSASTAVRTLPKLTKDASKRAVSVAIQTAIPNVPGMMTSMILLYVADNSLTTNKQTTISISPKKILQASCVPMIDIFVNSDIVTSGIDTIGDHTMHLAAEIVLQALKMALVCF